MNIHNIRDLFSNFSNYDKKSNRYTSYLQLFNCSLTGRNTNYPNCLIYTDKLISPYDEKVMSLNKDSFYDNNIFDYKHSEPTNIISNPVYFFIYNFENYYHFMYDTLPYLYNFLELKKTNPDLKLLISNTKLYQFNIDVFNLLGIEYIIHNNDNLYIELYVSSSLTHGGLSNNPPHELSLTVYNNFNVSNSF